ncbi:hypothetical protein AKO1_006669 [Acrasis kona]|uniref:Uncharacterized protein n=1 Tax=Acrasis kona TaxID=1008807 RepID=A0AAW2ZM06_9EUKA
MRPQEVDVNDIDQIIEQLGPCARVYWNMETCIDENNRVWNNCQNEVAQLKKCWEEQESLGLRTPQSDRKMMMELKKLKKSLN